MATAILTTLRQAAWNAIDSSEDLEDVFSKKFRFESALGLGAFEDLVPAPGELPAIAIYPRQSPTPWTLNQSQEIQYLLTVVLWTPHWSVLLPEKLWQYVVRALWSESGGLLGETTGTLEISNPTFKFLGSEDVVAMTRTEFGLTLPRFWNPRLDSGELE